METFFWNFEVERVVASIFFVAAETHACNFYLGKKSMVHVLEGIAVGWNGGGISRLIF